MNEFQLIDQYFKTQINQRADVTIGIGDDAAVIKPPPGALLAITTDTLVSERHFLQDTLPYDIGYKSLAVNLSDLAAMGANPAWVTLALTLPGANETWIEDFCAGFFTLANRYQVALIGGDLTRGPLTITIQATGILASHAGFLRSGAKPGDLIYVTGTLGDAALGLQILSNHYTVSNEFRGSLLEKLHRPEPRIATGIAMQTLASSAIDISDGFAADLGHILTQSQVGAIIDIQHLPLSEALTQTVSAEEALRFALTGGDDYELCFTIPPEKAALAEQKLSQIPCRYTKIGEITIAPGLTLRYPNGEMITGNFNGYQHF